VTLYVPPTSSPELHITVADASTLAVLHAKLDASDLVAGTVAAARLPATVAQTDVASTFTAAQTFGAISATSLGATPLNATNLTSGTVPAARLPVLPLRLGHTWGLVGDVSAITTLPSLFVLETGTQAAVLYGIRTKIASGTSVGVQVKRNGSNVGSVITVTTTAATTTLGSVALSDNDEITLVLSSPVGTPTHLSATLILEHTP
jgi:hypothetical protein